MPKTREQKQEMVQELSEKLSRIKSAVFTSVSGYTMTDADTLRAKGRKQGVEIAVSKKSLLVRALKEQGVNVERDQLEGSVLVTLGYDDEVSAAKLVAEFAKGREKIKMLGGVLEGVFVNGEAVTRLAKLPGKQELYAKIAGSLNAPISGFVRVLAGNLRGLVTVLDALKEKKA